MQSQERIGDGCLHKLERDSIINIDGGIKFKIACMIEAFTNKTSDQIIKGSSYQIYLKSRPMSMSEVSETRN